MARKTKGGAGPKLHTLFRSAAAAQRRRGLTLTSPGPICSPAISDTVTRQVNIAVFDGLKPLTDLLCNTARSYDVNQLDVDGSYVAFDYVSFTANGSIDSRTKFDRHAWQPSSRLDDVSPPVRKLLQILMNLKVALANGSEVHLFIEARGVTCLHYPDYPALSSPDEGPPAIGSHRDQGTEHNAETGTGQTTEALRADAMLLCLPQNANHVKSLEHYQVSNVHHSHSWTTLYSSVYAVFLAPCIPCF